MEHTLRRQKKYALTLDLAQQIVRDEGAVTITQAQANWYKAAQPLQGHQPRRSKIIELACDITKDEGAAFWRVTGWFEDYKTLPAEARGARGGHVS